MIPIEEDKESLYWRSSDWKKQRLLSIQLSSKEFYDKGEPVYCIYVAIGQKDQPLLI